MGSFQKFCLRWNNHSSNFVGSLGHILSSEEYSDVTICCQGEVWHLHQLVLSASSSHFAQLLKLTPPGKTPILILDGPPASDVNALIHFIYHGEVNVDQDSLPSLLRTAASLRIKGLADVTGLTQDINPDTFPTDDDIPNLSASLTSCGVALSSNGTEEMSPLNLSCHKNLESKEEESYSRCLLPPVEEKIIVEPPDPFLLPPSKRVRIHESQQPLRPSVGNIIQQSESQPRVTETNYIPVTVSQINCMNNNPTMTDNFLPSLNKEPSTPKFIPSQKPTTETVRIIPSNGSATFYSTSGSTSFPLLNMALAPSHVAYQQSSTTQETLETKRSENNSVSSFVQTVPNLCDKPQGSEIFSCKTPVIKNTDDTCTMQEKIHHSPHDTMQLSPHNLPVSSMEVCSSSTNNSDKRKKEVENQVFAVPSPEIGDSFPLQVEEKTFNHKKFSPCVIPNSNVNTKKTVQVISGVYTTNPTSTPFVLKKETTKEPFATNSETHVSTISPEILIQSPSIVKLTPVTVTNYSPDLTVANSFPPNSIIYTASGTPCENSIVTTPVCQIISNSKTNISTVDEKVNTIVSPQNSPPEINESLENCALSTSISFPATSTAHSTEGSTPTTQQRVTINMRTFKEEWRRQLLVDYDSRTNMSICMLCFTTFKSYDGPRKNTYVKHAKRFHPALEEYSDEERGVIISMYEKYHKYDIDMQKEINKSFRTTNNSNSSLKRLRASSDQGIPVPNSTSLNRLDTEGESSEEKLDLATETKVKEYTAIVTKDSAGYPDSSSSAHNSEKEVLKEEISNNNNNNNNTNLNDKNKKRKGEYHRENQISL